MANLEEVMLPILKEEHLWINKLDGAKKVPEKIKRLLYLPTLAHATAVYAHEKELSRDQKDMLILLFNGEATKAFGIISKHVQMTAGNSSSHRMNYYMDFERWLGRLVELLKEALDRCMDRETWSKKLGALGFQDEPLCDENKLEWERRVREHVKLKRDVFDDFIYQQKFSNFTSEAMKFICRFSAMVGITMEQEESMRIACKNLGMKLPIRNKIKPELGENDAGNTQKQDWDNDNPDYEYNSMAIESLNDDLRITLSALSKLLKPGGQIKYMRKSQRCKVHLAGLVKYLTTQKKQDSFSEAAFEEMEKRKERIQKQANK